MIPLFKIKKNKLQAVLYCGYRTLVASYVIVQELATNAPINVLPHLPPYRKTRG